MTITEHHGAAEGRDPGPNFSTDGYLAANPDGTESGVNPLVHGERQDKKERPASEVSLLQMRKEQGIIPD